MSLGAVDLFNQLAQNDFGFFQKIQSIASIMTRDVQTLTLDHTLQDAVELFRKGGFRHAPVVEDGDIVGIVSDRDLLRHTPPQLGTAAEGDGDRRYLRTPISQIMTRGPVSVGEDEPLQTALTRMLDRHVDCVLVHDAEPKLVGIVTATDFMKTVTLFHRVCTGTADLVRFRLVDLDMSRGLPLDLVFSRGARSVRDLMTKEVVTLRHGDYLETAMDTMQSHEVRHLPVLDEKDRVVGLLSDRQVLGALPLPVPPPGVRKKEERFRERLFASKKVPITKVGFLVKQEKMHSIAPDALLIEAIAVMMESGLSGMPVIDDDGKLCGMFTTTDILRVFRVVMQIGSVLSPGESAPGDQTRAA